MNQKLLILAFQNLYMSDKGIQYILYLSIKIIIIIYYNILGEEGNNNNSSKAQYFLLKKSFVLILYPLFSNISKNVFGSVPFNLNSPGVHSIKIRGT